MTTINSSRGPRRLRRQGDRLERRQIEASLRAVNVEADDVAGRIEVDLESRSDLTRLHAGRGFQLCSPLPPVFPSGLSCRTATPDKICYQE